ncbi:MAG: peptidoglycan-binding protein, partial [Woeseia sp.]
MANTLRPSAYKTFFLCALVILASPARAEWAVADAVRSYLEGLDAGAAPVIAGRLLEHPVVLSHVYRDRNHEPLWLAGAPLQEEVPAILAAISESVGHGFVAERYHRSTIEQLLRAEQNDARLALELLLTDTFLSQALHRSRGIVFPPNLDADWRVPQAEIDAGELLAATAGQRGSVTEVLAALWPKAVDYALLLKRRGEILAMGDEMTAQVAPGPLLRPGDSSDRILMLKQRLMGPGDYTPVYDEDLRGEVTAFQFAAGLEPDGIVGANTLEVLNV